jgi:hypothetical protein
MAPVLAASKDMQRLLNQQAYTRTKLVKRPKKEVH